MTTYVVKGNYLFGQNTPFSNTMTITENGLSAKTATDDFSLNGVGFSYNGNAATWNDVSTKVQSLIAIANPPNDQTIRIEDKLILNDPAISTNEVRLTGGSPSIELQETDGVYNNLTSITQTGLIVSTDDGGVSGGGSCQITSVSGSYANIVVNSLNLPSPPYPASNCQAVLQTTPTTGQLNITQSTPFSPTQSLTLDLNNLSHSQSSGTVPFTMSSTNDILINSNNFNVSASSLTIPKIGQSITSQITQDGLTCNDTWYKRTGAYIGDVAETLYTFIQNSGVTLKGASTAILSSTGLQSNGALTISTGAGQTIQLGMSTQTTNVEISAQTNKSVVTHIGDGDGNAVSGGTHINNGINNQSWTQIGNGSGSNGQINIGNEDGGTNTLNTINGLTTITKLSGNQLNGIASNSTQTIGSNIVNGTITIGGSITTGSVNIMNSSTTGGVNMLLAGGTGKVTVNGAGVASGTYDAVSTSGFSIGNNVTGGTVTFCTNNTSTNIYIGNFASANRGSDDANRLRLQRFSAIEQNISIPGNRSYVFTLGQTRSTTTQAEQYTVSYKSAVTTQQSIFQLNLNTGSTGNFGQTFELQLGGTSATTNAITGRYTFFINQQANTSAAIVSAISTSGTTLNTTSADFTFDTTTIGRVTIRYTPLVLNGATTANFTLKSFMTVNSNWIITPI
jgi:hypothetical protein